MSSSGTPEIKDQLFRQAGQAYLSGRLKEALQICEQIIAISQDDMSALNMAGVVAWQMGNLSASLRFLDQAITANPSDPQAYVNVGVILEEHGRLDEAANSYRASIEADPNHLQAHINLGNVLFSQQKLKQALISYGHALALDPNNVDALNNKGLVLKEMGQLELAETTLRSAVEKHPGFEPAWTNLGLILRANNKPQEAQEKYQRALAINPLSVKALTNLAVLLRWEGELEHAEVLCRKVLQTHPNQTEVLNNLGDLMQAQGRAEEAKVLFERVLALVPNHAEAHHNLAVLLLLAGDFKNGWKHYEWRWLAKEFPSERRNFTQPLWCGESLEGKTILLYVEQGMGDAIQFVRYIPYVHRRGGRVVIECPKSLRRLFETVEGAHKVIARGEKLPSFDVQCPFLSLPGIFSQSLEDIPADVPYIGVDRKRAEFFEDFLSDSFGVRVGLVWAGSPHHTNDRERSVPLKVMSPLASVRGCVFVSLQIGPASQQMESVDWPIANLTDHIHDYADTAALVSHLDLIITVDTSVAHMAGALGKAVWVLLPFAPDWRWLLGRYDSPWYPSMRLFRQPARRDWLSVIENVRCELEMLREQCQDQ